MKRTVMIIGFLIVYFIASATVVVAGQVTIDWMNGQKICEKDGYVYAVGKSNIRNVALARSNASSKAIAKLAKYLKIERVYGLKIEYYKSGKTWYALVRIKSK